MVTPSTDTRRGRLTGRPLLLQTSPPGVLELESHRLAGGRGVGVAAERNSEPVPALAGLGEPRAVSGVDEAVVVPVGELLHGDLLGTDRLPRAVAIRRELDRDLVPGRRGLEQAAGPDVLVGLAHL